MNSPAKTVLHTVPSTVTSEAWLHDQVAQKFISYKMERPAFFDFAVKTLNIEFWIIVLQ
jgi:hypothetical protein